MRPALIDTDPGVDDALALLLAWSSPEWAVDAITTVAGNVPLEATTVNVHRLLALRRPRPTPAVAPGAAAPLVRALRTATHYHGEDGLGDLPDWPAVHPAAPSAHAAEVMVAAADRHGPALTLVALGPLTNLALAARTAASTMRRTGRLVVMGGAVDVPGNVTPDAEFNIHVDPDAAREVVAAGLAPDFVPLDATRQAVLSRPALEAALARGPRALAARIAAFTAQALWMDERRGRGGLLLHDPLAVAAALDPTLVQWEPIHMVVGPDGQTRRGSGTPNCRFARAIDTGRFLALFLERLCPAS